MKKKLSTFVINRIIIVILITSGIMGTCFYYINGKISGEVDKINSNLNYLKSLENKDKIVAELNSDYQQIITGKNEIDQALPAKDNLIAFITELEAISESTGNLQNLSIADKVEQQKDKSVLKIEINLLGSYESIVNYMRSLEQLRYYTKINKISFKETQYDKLSAQADVLIYVEN